MVEDQTRSTSTEEQSAEEIARKSRLAFNQSKLVNDAQRNNILLAIAESLKDSKETIQEANRKDMQAAQILVDKGELSQVSLTRLSLQTDATFQALVTSATEVAALESPLGRKLHSTRLDEGLELFKVGCPIGCLLIIFESRPEVIINIAALAIKSGNTAIMKGGKESQQTCAVLTRVIRDTLEQSSTLSCDYVQTVFTRTQVSSLLQQDSFIDLVIPRGSNTLVKYIQNSTRIPVMGHADGICTVFLDSSCDSTTAARVVRDAKTNNPAVCNAAEILLIHADVLNTVWPHVAQQLMDCETPVSLKCDKACRQALLNSPIPISNNHLVQDSTTEDYSTEFLEYTLAVKLVPSIDHAIDFINEHGSHHTDVIVTQSGDSSDKFMMSVDSAGVYVNASSRFADGYRYGFGTEVGVSTGKMHARGPVGLEGLCTYKYLLRSASNNGHIVSDFGPAPNDKKYLHDSKTHSSAFSTSYE